MSIEDVIAIIDGLYHEGVIDFMQAWELRMRICGKEQMMRNPCKECDYYHKENNTCQSKKCCTGGDGTVTIIDRLFCKPYKYEADRKTEPQTEREVE